MGNTLLLILIALLLVVALVRLWAMSRRASSDPDSGLHGRRIGDGLQKLEENKAKYATLTQALLDETPDDALLEAMFANLWAKMDPELSNAADVMAAQSRDRQLLYAVYAVTGGVRQAGFSALRKQQVSDAILADAVEALDAMSMTQSASLLRDALAADRPDTYSKPYLEAFEAEEGKPRMVAYIRAHASGFIDA